MQVGFPVFETMVQGLYSRGGLCTCALKIFFTRRPLTALCAHKGEGKNVFPTLKHSIES